jgi:hypothetical protein
MTSRLPELEELVKKDAKERVVYNAEISGISAERLKTFRRQRFQQSN